jgi:hypothetical protein
VLVLQYLWSRKKVSDMSLLVTTPLNIPTLFLSDLYAPKLLAGLAIILAAVQFVAMRHVRHQGMKLI